MSTHPDSVTTTNSTFNVDFVPELNLGLRIECDLTNYIDRQISQLGYWEPLILEVINFFVKSGDVCVDVGANAGYLSLVMAKRVGSSGRVISFEPNLDIIDKFKRNLDLNPTLRDSIELYTLGLGERLGRMYVSPDTDHGLGNATLCPSPGTSTTHGVEVVALDSFQLTRLDFIKVDVEGMELDVLRGSEQTIRRCLPHIAFETLSTLPPEQHRPIENYLRTFGYQLYAMNHAYPQDNTFAIHSSRLQSVG
jgi:FkbM family methyltransferase